MPHSGLDNILNGVHTKPMQSSGYTGEGHTMMKITTQRIGEISEIVRMDGAVVGDIYVVSDILPGSATQYAAVPTGARYGTYRFESRQDAIAACVSYFTLGYWTNEL